MKVGVKEEEFAQHVSFRVKVVPSRQLKMYFSVIVGSTTFELTTVHRKRFQHHIPEQTLPGDTHTTNNVYVLKS